MSFCVIFHAAAESTNEGLWGLPTWDYSRSQSHMRINTTACPVLDGGGSETESNEVLGLDERASLLRQVRACHFTCTFSIVVLPNFDSLR